MRFLMIAALAAAGPALAQDEQCDARAAYAVALHGGAYDGAEPTQRQLLFIEDTADAMRGALADGDRAIDVVERAVEALESSALYNAGRASIVNERGYVENDASIMDGRDLNAGAVGSFVNTKSPVGAARLVMEQSRHVFVVGDRGEAYARELGAEPAPENWFTRAEATNDEPHGTVGAVALDRCGDLAAATSTGGYDAKVPGRLGDVPVIGAGTYADNRGGAVSATGHGEWFIRHAAAHAIVDRMRLLKEDVEIASRAVIDEMAAKGGYGAVIALDANGAFAAPHSSEGVIHAYASHIAEARAGLVSGPAAPR